MPAAPATPPPQHVPAVADAIAADLRAWQPGSGAQRALRDEYADFVAAAGASALDRDGGPEHLTASCFVFTPDISSVLLCFHKKGQFWVQLGGHIEATDASVADAALREAREEGGVGSLRLMSALPVDLDRHALGTAFGRCSVHWDLGYAAIAAVDVVPTVSDESEAVAWWPVDGLPESVPTGFRERLAGAVSAAQALLA